MFIGEFGSDRSEVCHDEMMVIGSCAWEVVYFFVRRALSRPSRSPLSSHTKSPYGGFPNTAAVYCMSHLHRAHPHLGVTGRTDSCIV